MNTALILSIVALVAVVVLIVLLSMQNHKIADLREALDDATYDLQTAQQHFHDALPTEVLTRQEVQLLIDEEVSRNVQAIADAQAQAAANAYLTEPVVESPKVIYFGRPTAERMFDDERKTFEAYETSYYRFTLMKDEPEQAIIDFCPTRQGAIKALDNRVKTIEPACDLTVNGEKPQTYRQLAQGSAVLKNGFWTVVKKVEIVYE